MPTSSSSTPYWPFDGDGSSQFADARQHGDVASTCDRSGNVGGAVQFDANNKGYFSIELTAGDRFDQMTTGTISLWVHWDDGLQTGSKAFQVFAPVLSRQQNGHFSTHLLGLSGLDPNRAGVRWRSELKCKTILEQAVGEPVGVGKWILFSFCDHSEQDLNRRRFLIYEIGIDGSGLRQVTGGVNDPLTTTKDRQTAIVEDFDPCYLPDGGFMFTSTRQQAHIRCQYGGRYFAKSGSARLTNRSFHGRDS